MIGHNIKGFALGGVLGIVSAVAYANIAYAGNGAPNGGCYNLEIIGQKSKTVDLTGTNGHALFVGIDTRTKILLSEGQYNVIDRNGTDGTASFSLPNPDPTNSGTTQYSVFMRLVGKPGTGVNLATCATDSTGTLFCSEDTISMTRIAGTSKFLNVSQQMLYIYADINGDGVIDRVPLFSSQLQDYYWQLDSQGRMHAQVKFCPVSTVVQ
jgi:hypothetical protein